MRSKYSLVGWALPTYDGRPQHSWWAVPTLLVLLLLATCCGANPARAQLWRQFVPTAAGAGSGDPRTTALGDPRTTQEGDYALTQEHGPWLIVAASFSGDGAEKQAQELVQELRERYRLSAYLYEMSFNFGEESPGRGLDEYGAPIRRRYQRGDQVRELAVLVGNFPSIDDPAAQTTLDHIKTMQPNALDVDAEETTQSMARVRKMEDALLEKLGKPRKRGPMAQAFFTRNPLLPPEYFVPQGVDPFVAKMNQGVQHSLLDCPGRYTVQVATFRGKTMLQSSATDDKEQEAASKGRGFWNWRKKTDRNPLVEAAENAHLLTEELRGHGYEAYEFHDRTESIVTIGSFAQAVQQLPDGRVVAAPAVQKIIETFGAAYNTPSDPLTSIGNDPTTQQLVEQQEQQFNLKLTSQQAQIVPGLNPKHVKILRGSGKRQYTERIIPLDVNPRAIETPRRSVSSAYAGS